MKPKVWPEIKKTFTNSHRKGSIGYLNGVGGAATLFVTIAERLRGHRVEVEAFNADPDIATGLHVMLKFSRGEYFGRKEPDGPWPSSTMSSEQEKPHVSMASPLVTNTGGGSTEVARKSTAKSPRQVK